MSGQLPGLIFRQLDNLVVRVANLAIADGSPILFVGLLGYAAWLVWLLVTGVRLVLMPRKVGAA